MRIGIIGSMQFIHDMLDMKEKLEALGHEAFLTDLHKTMIGKSNEEIEEIKEKNEKYVPQGEYWFDILEEVKKRTT